MTTMATRIGIRELRDSLTHVMRRVWLGETIEVTRHGEVVAMIIPSGGGRPSRIDRLVGTGLVTPGEPLTRPVVPHAGVFGTASAALQEDRDA